MSHNNSPSSSPQGEKKPTGPYAVGWDQRKRLGQMPGQNSPGADTSAGSAQEAEQPAPAKGGGIDPEEHHEWCTKMWSRMDRDESQELSSKELDCEQFHSILRSVLAPKSNSGTVGGATYNRSEMNMNRAINFCMQKADFSSDGTLNFKEFKSFMLYLRSAKQKSTADMIFALFDLDGDEEIEEAEFREIYRFYLGHFPTEDEFQEEWARLDRKGEQKVSRKDYIHWLRTSPNKLFRQAAEGASDEQKGRSQQSTMSKKSAGTTSLPDLQRSRRAISGAGRRSPGPGLLSWGTNSLAGRPKWNQRFNAGVNMNPHKPRGQRSYFSRPQSLPELKRYYQTHAGFERHIERLTMPTTSPRSPRDDPFGFVF